MSEPTAEQVAAIRAVIESGVGGDFQDVVTAVKSSHRIDVSAALVEEVYLQMREEKAAASPVPDAPQQLSPEETLQTVVRFAQQMGGFDRARAALNAVEKKLKDLV